MEKFLYKQKFNLSELAYFPSGRSRIFLLLDEEFLREIYLRHLMSYGYEVDSSNFSGMWNIAEKLKAADLLVMDIRDSAETHKLDFLRSLTRDFPGLSVITVGRSLDEKVMQLLMGFGVVGHLDRQFSRPHDLVILTKTILLK